MIHGNELSGEAFRDVENHYEQLIRSSFASRPTFGLGNWRGAAAIDEWSFGGGVTQRLKFTDGNSDAFIKVTTTDADGESIVRNMKRDILPFPKNKLEASRINDEVNHASVSTIVVTVCGTSKHLLTWSLEEYQWGVCEYGCATIVVQTHRLSLEGLILDFIDNIEPFIAGRRSAIMQARPNR